MRTVRVLASAVAGGLVCFLLFTVSVAVADDVQGFSGVPVYPGLEQSDDAGQPAVDQVVYECSGAEPGERYAEDPEAFAAHVVAYYQDRLPKNGWDYLGEGAGRHHWSKGDQAVALRVLDYCAIEYRRLGLDEARANMGVLDEKDFFTALTGCVTAAQTVCSEHGAGDFAELQKTSQEFMARGDTEGLDAYQGRLRGDCRAAMWTSLKPYGVTPERLAELFEDREDLADRWMQEYGAFVAENAMGWVMVQQLAE